MVEKRTEKIPDYFGNYIGGARRDEWRIAGLSASDLESMNSAEMKKWVKRDSVWPLPDAQKAVEGGASAFIVYWARMIRRITYPCPIVRSGEKLEDKAPTYITALRDLKEHVEAVRSEQDLDPFYYYAESADLDACVNKSILNGTLYQLTKLKSSCYRIGFPYARRKTVKERKKSFIPPQLERIEREGPDYRFGIHVKPERWQDTFLFWGVEFGNWTSQKDRQYSLDYAYDALKDLACALSIEDKDIAFGGKLSLAFGARGHSGASAHYEPERKVINLTKIHGAGCTAHEWFHALDNFLAEHFGITDSSLASESKQTEKLPESFVSLIHAMKQDADGNPTDYFRGSRRFDKKYAKDGFGYWASNCEMAARAFACYIKDILGCKSDYLIAHADVYVLEFDDQRVCAIPQGEEREILDELFDQMLFDLKNLGFFHERNWDERPEMFQDPALDFAFAGDGGASVRFFWGEDGQMMFG